MSSNNREIKLSQDLMELQVAYNALMIEYNRNMSQLQNTKEDLGNSREYVKYLSRRLGDKESALKKLTIKCAVAERECKKECFLN